MIPAYNILVSGVGGQGSLLAGSVIASAAMKKNLRPVVGEIFGASRRGGGVLTHIRLADTDLAPLIPRGYVDVLLGMEPLETLRAAVSLASMRTIVLMSTSTVQTLTTSAGEEEYPDVDRVIEVLNSFCGPVYRFDATEALEKAGNSRALNMFMLGMMAGLEMSPLKTEELTAAIAENLKDSESSILAFKEGIKICVDLEPVQ